MDINMVGWADLNSKDGEANRRLVLNVNGWSMQSKVESGWVVMVNETTTSTDGPSPGLVAAIDDAPTWVRTAVRNILNPGILTVAARDVVILSQGEMKGRGQYIEVAVPVGDYSEGDTVIAKDGKGPTYRVRAVECQGDSIRVLLVSVAATCETCRHWHQPPVLAGGIMGKCSQHQQHTNRIAGCESWRGER